MLPPGICTDSVAPSAVGDVSGTSPHFRTRVLPCPDASSMFLTEQNSLLNTFSVFFSPITHSCRLMPEIPLVEASAFYYPSTDKTKVNNDKSNVILCLNHHKRVNGRHKIYSPKSTVDKHYLSPDKTQVRTLPSQQGG